MLSAKNDEFYYFLLCVQLPQHKRVPESNLLYCILKTTHFIFFWQLDITAFWYNNFIDLLDSMRCYLSSSIGKNIPVVSTHPEEHLFLWAQSTTISHPNLNESSEIAHTSQVSVSFGCGAVGGARRTELMMTLRSRIRPEINCTNMSSFLSLQGDKYLQCLI